MASPLVHVRLTERLRNRVVAAAQDEHLSVSAWLRRAVLNRLGDSTREAAERAELLAEARRFLAVPIGDSSVDRDAHSLVSRYMMAIEAQAGRLSLAEQRGRVRALAEVCDGALEPLDGAEVAVVHPPAASIPVILETTSPVRRGFLREALAAERARALLQAPPPPCEPPSAVALLGQRRVKDLWNQAVGWPGRVLVFCPAHGVTPCAPSSGGGRCYLGCTIPTGPEVT